MDLLAQIVQDYGVLASIVLVALLIVVKSKIEIHIKYGGKKD